MRRSDQPLFTIDDEEDTKEDKNEDEIDESKKDTDGIKKSPVQCVFVFRRPVMLSDRIIKMLSGPFAHVDLYVHMENKVGDSPSFTTFMGERFSMSINMKHYYNNKDYVGLHLRMDLVESMKLFDYVIDLVDHKIPYNFSDLLYQPMKSVLRHSVFFPDVHSENPEELQKVFCSQAFVLGLRNSLHDNDLAGALIDESLNQRRKLLWTLSEENSRLCTPTDLHDILRPFCRRVNMDRVRHGYISYE